MSKEIEAYISGDWQEYVTAKGYGTFVRVHVGKTGEWGKYGVGRMSCSATPEQFRKFCQAGLQICDELEAEE